MKIQRHWLFCKETLQRIAPLGAGQFFAAEIGCASGSNAAMMLRDYPGLRLWMMDPWEADPKYIADILETRKGSPYLANTTLNQAEFNRWYDRAMEVTEFARNRREVIREPSADGARWIPDKSLSFCFIDGDHREAGVAADLRAYWPKMKAGGIFAGHDYGTCGHDGVKRSVDAWVAEMGLTLSLRLPGEYRHCWYVEVPKTLMEVFA